MLKKLMLASALVATSAMAQQNTDISGANFQSGSADATLASLGRQAAASGNKLVITAPADWHARIAAKVRAGGNASLVLKEGFYENLLVRVEDKSAKPAAEPEKTTKADVEKSRAEAEKAKAEAEKSRAEAEKAKAEAEVAKSQAETEKAKAEAETAKARAQTEQAAAARATATRAPAAAPTPTSPPPATVNVEAIHTRFEQSLNNGRSADGSLPVASLQTGDTLYVDGPVRAITRREGGHMGLYWLEGDLDLRRSELKVIAPNRYQLLASIRGEGSMRRDAAPATGALAAAEPAADAAERLALEKSINDGHTITDTLVPAKLRSGDLIYVNGNTAAIVRREGNNLARFWLIGSFDLKQAGVLADGANKYKVQSDTVR